MLLLWVILKWGRNWRCHLKSRHKVWQGTYSKIVSENSGKRESEQTVELKHLLRLDSVCEGELQSVITKAACYEQEGYVRLSKSKNLRSSLPEVFCKKDVLRNFAKFTGEYSLFFTKLQAWGSGTVVFLWILWNF